jgi:Ca2+:H+ antiporter
MSLAVSVVLGVVYLLSLLYTLVTHKHLFMVERATPSAGEHRARPLPATILVLLFAVGLGGFESYLLVNSITPLIAEMNITQRFAGVVLIAIMTNIPEHISAISFARRNNMTMSLEIGMSSALQIALFVIPALVLISTAVTGATLDLVFGPFSLIALLITAMIANYISTDGICHWLEGVQLTAVYVLIAIAFYFI